MKLPTLSPELEQALLSAVIHGVVPQGELQADELSKPGKVLLGCVEHLTKGEAVKKPLSSHILLATAVDIHGFDRADMVPYLKDVMAAKPSDRATDVLEEVRKKRIITTLINECGNQLTSGELSLSALTDVLREGVSDAKLESLADYLGEHGVPEPPSGPTLRHLPALSKVTRGMHGLWAVAGEPAVGKSTFGVQLATYCAEFMPVLYYDFENGAQVILSRLADVFEHDRKILSKLLRRFYLREDIATLDSDLMSTKAPALIVIDSVQKLPASVMHRRTSLDKWIRKFEKLKRNDGYTVLLLSEKERGTYDTPTMRGFKETGEIEYSADFGVQLQKDNVPGLVNFHVVKNRHNPYTGHVLTLQRVNGCWFKEVASYVGGESVSGGDWPRKQRGRTSTVRRQARNGRHLRRTR